MFAAMLLGKRKTSKLEHAADSQWKIFTQDLRRNERSDIFYATIAEFCDDDCWVWGDGHDDDVGIGRLLQECRRETVITYRYFVTSSILCGPLHRSLPESISCQPVNLLCNYPSYM